MGCNINGILEDDTFMFFPIFIVDFTFIKKIYVAIMFILYMAYLFAINIKSFLMVMFAL